MELNLCNKCFLIFALIVSLLEISAAFAYQIHLFGVILGFAGIIVTVFMPLTIFKKGKQEIDYKKHEGMEKGFVGNDN